MRSTTLFVVSLVVAALSGAVLILLVPSMFDSGYADRGDLALGLAGCCLVAGFVARLSRPRTTRT